MPRIIDPSPKSLLASILWLLAAVALPTGARLLLDPWLQDKVVYALYYPASLLLALCLGPAWGAVCLLLSALAASYFFLTPRYDLLMGKPDEAAGLLVFLLAGGLIVATASGLRRAWQRLELAREREAAMNAELQHRVKNSLAVVQGLARQSLRNRADPEAYEQFRERLIALAQAHDLLVQGEWLTCELPKLAEAALQPFLGPRLSLSGPECTLPGQACVPLVLALHELATNAMKHGALSSPSGKVSLRWRLIPAGNTTRVELRWVEVGGPIVSPPSRRGFGSRLLASQAGLESVHLHFEPAGVVCEISVLQHLRPGPARPARHTTETGGALLTAR
jgi:two-component sensor histidine kinase